MTGMTLPVKIFTLTKTINSRIQMCKNSATNIYHFKFRATDSPRPEQEPPSQEYWLSRDIGLIKIKISIDSSDWELVKYHINQ